MDILWIIGIVATILVLGGIYLVASILRRVQREIAEFVGRVTTSPRIDARRQILEAVNASFSNGHTPLGMRQIQTAVGIARRKGLVSNATLRAAGYRG